MEVGEMIYGSVSAVYPIDGIYFMIESCAVVDEESGREYSFISDRCPNRALDGQLAIPDAEEVRFAFRAFSFTGGAGNKLSVSCQIQECSIEDPTNPCEISPMC